MRIKKYQIQSTKYQYLLVLMVLLIMLGGCKTVKETVQAQSNVVAAENKDVQVTADSVSQTNVNNTLVDKSELNDSLAINEVTVVLSKPDSVGKQYTESITYRETTKLSGIKKDITQHKDSVSTTNTNAMLTDKSDYKSEASVSTDIKTKSKSRNPLTWLFVILGFGACVLAYFILRRFGLIK